MGGAGGEVELGDRVCQQDTAHLPV
jgi:hypothetical protein